MHVFIDTNIIISAMLFPTGIASKAYYKAVSYPYKPMICDITITELREVFTRKFPEHLTALEKFIDVLSASVEIAETPNKNTDIEMHIRDVKDRPILRAALAGGADIILTGDKDFLESDIKNPQIFSAGDFLKL